MGVETEIAWCHHTFNPWEGCQRVSPGCEHCYAEARNARFHPDEDRARMVRESTGKRLAVATHWGRGAPRLMRSESYWREPEKWNRAARDAGERRRVFCASLADVFEDRPDLVEPRARLFRLIEECDLLDWLLLTKRPENMRRLASVWGVEWPRHVWAGTTAEDQQRANERIPHLLATPAAVRFVSAEPLLGPVDLTAYLYERRWDATMLLGGVEDRRVPGLDWVIAGGESGPGARPHDLTWSRSVREQCAAAGVAYFQKQLGERPIWPERFTWSDDGDGGLVLKSDRGRVVANVWKTRTWHTWDVNGVGGENAEDPTMEIAKSEVLRALRRQGRRDPDYWHVSRLRDHKNIDLFPAELRVREFPRT